MHTLLLLAVLSVAVAAPVAADRPAAAQSTGPTLAIDVGPPGNSATLVGEIEDCVSVALGEEFEINLVIQDVTDLLAWEAPLDFDPAVVVVLAHDVKVFQAANTGSSVIDISAQTPDDSGFHTLSAFESSDPPRADSGSGVLATVTLEAVGAGESALAFGERDFDADGVLDRGALLRNLDAEAIGDENDDNLFDGTRLDARVVVGEECPPGTNPYVAESGSSDGSSSAWPYVAGAVAAGVAVLGLIGGVFVMSRRRAEVRSRESNEPQQ